MALHACPPVKHIIASIESHIIRREWVASSSSPQVKMTFLRPSTLS